MGCISSKILAGTDANSCLAQDGRAEAVSAYSRLSLPTQGSGSDCGRDASQRGGKSSPAYSQSEYPLASSMGCELGTNAAVCSEASSERSSICATSAAERDDVSATDHWSMLNDELAPRSFIYGSEIGHIDSPLYAQTEISRDEQWATRSNGTVGDPLDRYRWSCDVLHIDQATNGVAYDSASSSLAPSETKETRR